MASPLFKPMTTHHTASILPRATGTSLFMQRMKKTFAQPKVAKNVANGHPVIHQPIVVRPARPTHTSTTQLY